MYCCFYRSTHSTDKLSAAFVQCGCDAVSRSTVTQFVLLMLQPLMSGLAFSPSLARSDSQRIATRCSKHRAITDSSFKVPYNRLQSFLYWHQYGELHQNSPNTITKLEFCDGLLVSYLSQGLVNHGTSHGLKARPKFYRFQEPGAQPVGVTSINFSPFRQNMFLVSK